MACQISASRPIECKGAGGIKAAYLFNYGDITPVVALNEITDLGTATAYEYEIRSASNLVQSQNVTEAGIGVNQVITLIIQSQNKETNEQLSLWGAGLTHIAIHYKTGETVVAGLEFGAELTTAVADSGTVLEDGQFYTLTVNANERLFALFIEGSTLDAPFDGMSGAGVITIG